MTEAMKHDYRIREMQFWRLDVVDNTASLPAGVTLVSADPQDPALLGAGLQRFMSVPAPAWVGGTAVNAPLARSEHTAIWTGREWLVWGGNVGSGGR